MDEWIKKMNIEFYSLIKKNKTVIYLERRKPHEKWGEHCFGCGRQKEGRKEEISFLGFLFCFVF
jgi:hypothetical protein